MKLLSLLFKWLMPKPPLLGVNAHTRSVLENTKDH